MRKKKYSLLSTLTSFAGRAPEEGMKSSTLVKEGAVRLRRDDLTTIVAGHGAKKGGMPG